MEKTLIIIKPDALVSGLVGRIVSIIEKKGFKISGLKMIRLMPKKARGFYRVHKGMHFYTPLVKFMTSNPCFVMVVSGRNAVRGMRKIMGNTDPGKAEKGTIRRLFAVDNRHNVIHGSDSPENAEKEIRFFFTNNEVFRWEKKKYKI